MKAFCECYDLKAHSTNIFQDIINSLGAYVQSLFADPCHTAPTGNASAAVSLSHGTSASTPTGPGIPQPGFFSRGVWLPLLITFTPGQAKSV